MNFVDVTVLHDNAYTTVSLAEGESILEGLRRNGLYIPAICGGEGVCGKCKIKLLEGALLATSADERYFTKDELEQGFRLACLARPKQHITISICGDNEESFSAVSYFKQQAEEEYAGLYEQHSEKPYGVAIDIGTTTIAFTLVDLTKGIVVDNLTVVNMQREYGADVISRILSATNGNLSKLSATVRKQIKDGIFNICEKNEINLDGISDISIAANTTMIHMLLGLSCDTLGVYPFTPVTLMHMVKDYGEIFEGNLKAKVHILPGISTYVGADIASGIYFSELYKNNKPSVLIDIGTNGEMAVYKEGAVLCTATAAGPAFEGGNISWGTGSVNGAVSSAKYENGRFKVQTIGGAPPIGICGSGVIDIVSECLKHGLIDITGRYESEYSENGITVATTADGRSINFTQKDIRELQMGKSAIRSGLDSLLAFSELTYDDISTLYIAGGFGFRINFENGAAIGLIPEPLLGKISLIGNSSLGGAVKYLLNEGAGKELQEIIGASSEHSLPTDKLFSRLFMENMSF